MRPSAFGARALFLTIMVLFSLTAWPMASSTGESPGPTFRATMDRLGAVDVEVPGHNGLLWSFQTDEQVQSTPIPYNGKVFFGSDDGHVYAVDAMWGTEVWSVDTEASVMATPTISDDGVLYIGSTNRVMYALDPETGDELWRFKVPDRFGQIESTAALDEDRLYFGTSDRRFYAVDLDTHEESWNFSTGGEIWSSPALWGDRVYFGSLDGNVYCLWKENGTKLWNFSTPTYEGVYSSPAVVDGVVVFGTPMGDNGIYALDATTGAVIWRFQSPGPSYASPAVHDGTVYIPAWGPPGRLYALPLVDPTPGDGNLTQGDVKWSAEIGDEQGGSSPLYSQGKVLVGSDFGMGGEGRLFCLNADNGNHLWNLSTGGDVYSSPTLDDGVVFIGSNDGRVYAVGGDPNARLEVEVLPEATQLQGGRVIGIDFIVSYRGLPLEGAYIKFSVTQGELSQSGASTFPDGSQRIKYQAPEVTADTVVRIDAEASFVGVVPSKGSANITIVPSKRYDVSSESAFNIMNYALYIGLISLLIVANVAIVAVARRGGGVK